MAELKVPSDISARVWKIEVAPGDAVDEGAVMMILEAMKVEIPVDAPKAGKVTAILVSEGDSVEEGQVVAVLEI